HARADRAVVPAPGDRRAADAAQPDREWPGPVPDRVRDGAGGPADPREGALALHGAPARAGKGPREGVGAAARVPPEAHARARPRPHGGAGAPRAAADAG